MVSANPVSDPEPEEETGPPNVYLLTLINFPINGCMLVLCYVLISMEEGPPERHPASKHMIRMVGVVLVLTLLGAVIDTIAFNDDSPTWLSFFGGAVLILILVAFLVNRYLGVDATRSLLIGGVFMGVNMFTWFLLFVLSAETVEDFIYNYMPLYSVVFIEVFVLLLVLETYFLHITWKAPSDDKVVSPRDTSPLKISWKGHGIELGLLLIFAFAVILTAHTVMG